MKSAKFLLSMALVCLAVPAFAAAPLTDFLNAADRLQLAPNAAPVSNLTFAVGHMKMTLASGSATRLLAGGDTVGFFFTGNGSFEYETTDTAELPVVNHNVKAVAHVKLVADAAHAVISDNFTEVLMVGGGVPWPELAGSGAPAVADAFAAHEETFGRLDQVQSRSHFLALQKFSFPSAKMIRAEFAGGRDKLLYIHDNEDESLSTVAPLRTYTEDKRIQQRLFPSVLSQQPVGRDRATAVRPPFALTAVDYTLTADGDNAKLEITETVTRVMPSTAVLDFDMNYERIVRANVTPRKYNVRSVTDEQGRALPFDHDRDDLLVAADGIAGQTFKLKFVIDGDFVVREGGDNAWQLGLGSAWMPLPPQWSGQSFTVHSVVKVKKPFIAFAPGTTVKRAEEGDFNVVENVLDKPVQFTTVQAGKYVVYEEKQGERTIRVATYGLRNDRAAKQLTNLAFGIIDELEIFLGPFPYNELNIIQMNEYGYGQAPPGTMYITNEAFNPTKSSDDEEAVSAEQLFSKDINKRFAHELSHQYWGYVVRMPSAEEQWLSESFAEYSAAIVLKRLRGDAVYNRLVSTWKGRAKDGVSVAPIPYANRIEGDYMMSFMARNALLYAKGPYLLYTLHKEVGDNVFLTFLKSYTKSFNFKYGTTKDVAGLLGFITKKDYKPFFEQYYWGTAMPQ
jgi:hypothetical protein